VTSLKESGLITGRPQGRSVYYRLARPELDSLLEAAETLLAAAGQRVRLHRHDKSSRRNDAHVSRTAAAPLSERPKAPAPQQKAAAMSSAASRRLYQRDPVTTPRRTR
jgi:hypothetical protein